MLTTPREQQARAFACFLGRFEVFLSFSNLTCGGLEFRLEARYAIPCHGWPFARLWLFLRNSCEVFRAKPTPVKFIGPACVTLALLRSFPAQQRTTSFSRGTTFEPCPLARDGQDAPAPAQRYNHKPQNMQSLGLLPTQTGQRVLIP